jgi:RNA polymerase sigma factor (sigma-70 family)
MTEHRTSVILDLVDRLQAGDEGARDDLLRYTQNRLTRLARKMLKGYPVVHRWEETDDVLQDACLRLLKALEVVKPTDCRGFFNLAATQIRRELIDLARHYTHDKRRPSSDLQLMSPVNGVSGIPTEGQNLILVAAVDDRLLFRIFDGKGKKVVDTDETRLTEPVRRINELRKQLVGLWPPHELTEGEKRRVITAVTSIVGPTRHGGADEPVTGPVRPQEPSDDPGKMEVWIKVHEAIASLPEQDREIFGLLWYQELTQVEAAKVLGLTKQGVNRRWAAAKMRLHEKTGGQLPAWFGKEGAT